VLEVDDLGSGLEVRIMKRKVSTSIPKTNPRMPPAALWNVRKVCH